MIRRCLRLQVDLFLSSLTTTPERFVQSLPSTSVMSEPVNKKCRLSNGSAAKTPLEEFDEVFPQIVKDVVERRRKDMEITDAMEWFKEVCNYNVPHGKKNRGLTVVMSLRYLVSEAKLSEEQIYKARVLGWCVEFLQAYFLVLDDIMDHSITRRGRPCWYKKEGVGLIAINDALFLEACIYDLIKQHCREESYYVHVLELFHETNFQTITGQCLDMLTAPPSVDFSRFTQDRYNAIVKWKTAFYSFYLPVALAMHMAGIHDADSHYTAKKILLQMGEYFQIQDDYLDCYGDPEVTGKVGTDIEDNKCSWLVVQALQRASAEQRKILEDNYAQTDPSKVAKVKAVYKELSIEQVYKQYEEDSYQELTLVINKLNGKLPKEMFQKFMEKIYKRNK